MFRVEVLMATARVRVSDWHEDPILNTLILAHIVITNHFSQAADSFMLVRNQREFIHKGVRLRGLILNLLQSVCRIEQN